MRVWILTAVIALLSYGSLAWGQTLPSVDDFFEYEDMSAPAMSPNGDQICVVDKRQADAHRVSIINLDDFSDVSHLPFSDKNVSWCRWISEDRLMVSISLAIVTYAVRSKKFIRLDSKSDLLITFSLDGKNATRLPSLGSHTEVVSMLPDQPEIIMLSAYDRGQNLIRMNVVSGEWEQIENGTDFTWAYKLNRDGVAIVRYDLVGGGRHVRIMMREVGQKRWSKLTTVRRKDLKIFLPVAETNIPGIMYISARPEGYDRAAIFKYDLKNKEFLEVVSSHHKVDLHRVLTTVNDEYVGTIYYDDKLKYDFADDSYQSNLKFAENFFSHEMGVSIRSVSNDGKRWIIFTDSPRHPGSYYSFDLEKRRIEKIYDTMTTLRPDQLGKTDWIEYAARDGIKLNAYLTHPAGGGAYASAPLIVMPHGGPEVRDYYGYDEMLQFLASRGYRIFQPIFRGSEGYGKAFAEAGYGEWGGLMQDDVTDGVQHLIDSGKVQKEKICIAGASYGGYAALMGAIKTPDFYKCAISIAGVTDLREMVRYDGKEHGKTSEVYKYVVKTMGNPRQDKERMMANSPTLQADKINIPILVIQGGDDDIVPPEQGRIFNAAMKNAGKDIRYVEYENMNHNLIGLTDAMKDTDDDADDDLYVYYKKTLREMEDFLAQHLK